MWHWWDGSIVFTIECNQGNGNMTLLVSLVKFQGRGRVTELMKKRGHSLEDIINEYTNWLARKQQDDTWTRLCCGDELEEMVKLNAMQTHHHLKRGSSLCYGHNIPVFNLFKTIFGECTQVLKIVNYIMFIFTWVVGHLHYQIIIGCANTNQTKLNMIYYKGFIETQLSKKTLEGITLKDSIIDRIN